MQRAIVCLISGLLLTGASVYAQTANIAGTIVDASDAGVPGATVTAKNAATAGVRTAITTIPEPIRYPISRSETTR